MHSRINTLWAGSVQGIEACPKKEDVWLEAARLQTQENARAVLARGVQTLPTSVKLWMQVLSPTFIHTPCGCIIRS